MSICTLLLVVAVVYSARAQTVCSKFLDYAIEQQEIVLDCAVSDLDGFRCKPDQQVCEGPPVFLNGSTSSAALIKRLSCVNTECNIAEGEFQTCNCPTGAILCSRNITESPDDVGDVILFECIAAESDSDYALAYVFIGLGGLALLLACCVCFIGVDKRDRRTD